MRDVRRKLRAFSVIILVSLTLACALNAQDFVHGPNKWWPSADSGLMWMSWEASPEKKGGNQQQAANHCSTSQVGGFSSWRLPTAAEIDADSSMQVQIPREPAQRLFKTNAILFTFETYVWTSTPDGPDFGVAVNFGFPWSMVRNDAIDKTGTFHKVKVTNSKGMGVICTRQMEPEIAQAAKAAHIDFPVESLQILEVNVPLTLAWEAFKAGKYQDCLVQTKRAVEIMPTSAFSFSKDGLCSGMAGKWDDAIADEQAAVRLDKSYRYAKYLLKWAEDGKVSGLDADHNKWPGWDCCQY